MLLNLFFFFRTKMQSHYKKYIDNLYKNCFYNKCEVRIMKLTTEHIANYTL